MPKMVKYTDNRFDSNIYSNVCDATFPHILIISRMLKQLNLFFHLNEFDLSE